MGESEYLHIHPRSGEGPQKTVYKMRKDVERDPSCNLSADRQQRFAPKMRQDSESDYLHSHSRPGDQRQQTVYKMRKDEDCDRQRSISKMFEDSESERDARCLSGV